MFRTSCARRPATAASWLLMSAIAAITTCGGSLVGAEEAVRIALSTPKANVLIGEPVVLDLSVTNGTSEAMEADRINTEGWTNLRIRFGAAGGKTRHVPRPNVEEGPPGPPVSLAPGGKWCFRVRLCHSARDRDTFLLIPRAGKYQFQVELPSSLVSQTSREEHPVVSNLLVIQVREPVGKEVEARRLLWQQEVIAAMTDGFQNEPSEDSDRLVLRVCQAALEADPSGGYVDEIKRLIREYYVAYSAEFEALPEAERNRLRKLVQIPEKPKRVEPFPEDRRLDLEVLYDYPKKTPWPDVFKELSRQSGVPLRVAPDLADLWTLARRRKTPLREILFEYGRSSGVRWFADGDGYVLKRAAKEPDPEPPYAPCPKSVPMKADPPAAKP